MVFDADHSPTPLKRVVQKRKSTAPARMEKHRIKERNKNSIRALMPGPPVQGLKGVFFGLYHPDRKQERCKRRAGHNKPKRGKGRQHRHQRQQQPHKHSPPGCRPVYTCPEGKWIGIQIVSMSHPLRYSGFHFCEGRTGRYALFEFRGSG